MALTLKDSINKILGISEDIANQNVKQKVSKLYDVSEDKPYNPFLDKNGELLNPYMDYQTVLNNPNVSQKAKEFISKATGLTPVASTVNKSIKNSSIVAPTQIPSDNSISKVAQSYIGTPYVWGGESMEEGGMDCSGFVYNALKGAGRNVERTTAQGYRSYGTSVSKDNLQEGDLVFYGKNGKATHIGIYIGNGQIVHSAGGSKNTKTNPGKGVSVTTLNHRSDFIEARRI